MTKHGLRADIGWDKITAFIQIKATKPCDDSKTKTVVGRRLMQKVNLKKSGLDHI